MVAVGEIPPSRGGGNQKQDAFRQEAHFGKETHSLDEAPDQARGI